MKTAELVITNAQERAECAKILVKAGYRVCVVSKTVGKPKSRCLWWINRKVRRIPNERSDRFRYWRNAYPDRL